jgi:hypothetical protein
VAVIAISVLNPPFERYDNLAFNKKNIYHMHDAPPVANFSLTLDGKFMVIGRRGLVWLYLIPAIGFSICARSETQKSVKEYFVF